MICYACQMDSLKQRYPDTIYCDSCNSKWRSAQLSGMKANSEITFAVNCKACGAPLTQPYPNNIVCSGCNTRWINPTLSQFGRSLKRAYAKNYSNARKTWDSRPKIK